MKILSPAKINLVLSIGNLLPDSYHQVDSIFHLVDLFDVLHFVEADEMSLKGGERLTSKPEDNLILKAAHSFKEIYPDSKNYQISLEKNIPHGAGLGGGSSNAAATLYALSKMHGISPSSAEILNIASSLGADVPVFLSSSAANLMGGRGDELRRALKARPDIHLVLAMPQKSHVPTAEVYKTFDANPKPQMPLEPMLEALKEGGASDIAAALANNLEEASFLVDSRVKELRDILVEHPLSLGAIVSGSGAASLAICQNRTDALSIAQDLEARGFWVFETRLSACSLKETSS